MWLSSGALNQLLFCQKSYKNLITIGIWSRRLFELAGLLLVWTVGWSGMVDRKLSNFVLNGMTELGTVNPVSLTSRGRRLKSFAPLTARLPSITLLTWFGALLLISLTTHSLPLLGLFIKFTVYPSTRPTAHFHRNMTEYLSRRLS